MSNLAAAHLAKKVRIRRVSLVFQPAVGCDTVDSSLRIRLIVAHAALHHVGMVHDLGERHLRIVRKHVEPN